MVLQTNEYSIAFDAVESRVVFRGALRQPGNREYASLKELLRTIHDREPEQLVLDFRDLQYLNSSGLGTIGQFIVEAREADKVMLILEGSAAYPWQGRTFRTFQRLWPKVKVTIE